MTASPWTAELEARVKELLAAATPGPWQAGRDDLQSYDGVTGEPFTAVYADNPNGELHLGCQLPFVVARAFDESGRSKADAALIAAAPVALESALAEIERLRREIDHLLFAGDDPRAFGPLPEDQPTRRRR